MGGKRCTHSNGRKWRLRILLLLATYHLSLAFAAAQTTFTQRVQQQTAGEGTVTISHAKEIDDLVNGARPATAQPKQTAPAAAPKKSEPKPADNRRAEQRRDTTATSGGDTTDVPIDTRKKVMRNSYKVTGYRVQAFAGGNQRTDRQQAEHIGNTIKAKYPDVPVYVHFYSPRWICRIGNYRTYEEAHQMLLNVRKLGISGASIVKGKITVQY